MLVFELPTGFVSHRTRNSFCACVAERKVASTSRSGVMTNIA
jgi:hypothetical protein